MSAFRILLIAIAAIAATSLHATSASATAQSLVALLYGGNEVAGGDPDGYGIATVTRTNTKKICVTVLVTGIEPPSAMHIHAAPAGSNGGVLIGLNSVKPNKGDPGVSSGCVKADKADINALLANPDQYYLNVHNATYPGGAVRGQFF